MSEIKIEEGLIFLRKALPSFSCKNCGECCDSTPSITMADVLKLSSSEQEKLELLEGVMVSFPAVIKGELIIVNERSPLIISPKSVNDKCIFYDKGCLINDHKPLECKLNPFSVKLAVNGSNFVASAFLPNPCEGIKAKLVADKNFDELLINHLKDMIMHEYFIMTIESIPSSIKELVSLWLKKLPEIKSKSLFSMLKLITKQRRLEHSKLTFKTCC